MFDPVPRAEVFAQLASTTPPTDSIVSLLSWALSGLLGILFLVAKMREKERKDELTRTIVRAESAEEKLALQDAKHDKEVAALQARYDREIEMLREMYGELQADYTKEVRRTATSLVLAHDALTSSRPRQLSRHGEEILDADFEETTGVHNEMNAHRRTQIEELALERKRAKEREVSKLTRDFVEETPPRPYRPRQPSKTDK